MVCILKNVGSDFVCMSGPPLDIEFLLKCWLVSWKARFPRQESFGPGRMGTLVTTVSRIRCKMLRLHGIPLCLLLNLFLTNRCPQVRVLWHFQLTFLPQVLPPHLRILQVDVTAEECCPRAQPDGCRQ